MSTFFGKNTLGQFFSSRNILQSNPSIKVGITTLSNSQYHPNKIQNTTHPTKTPLYTSYVHSYFRRTSRKTQGHSYNLCEFGRTDRSNRPFCASLLQIISALVVFNTITQNAQRSPLEKGSCARAPPTTNIRPIESPFCYNLLRRRCGNPRGIPKLRTKVCSKIFSPK